MEKSQIDNSLYPTVLVTGAKGQLGKKIIDLLSDKYALVLTDSEEMDITDKSMVNQVLESSKPDIIIHGAAYTKVDAAEENKELCYKINSEGTKNIAEAARQNGAILIYISTDFVFDGDNKTPYLENNTPKPLSVYGQTKFEGEKYVQEICDKYYIIRVSWLFGELPDGHPGTNFVEAMLKLAKERDSLNIVNDQIGSPTYTNDLVNVIDQIIRSQDLGVRTQVGKNLKPTTYNLSPVPYGIYHFSGNNACSWYDFAKEIFKQTGNNIKLNPITSDQYPQKAKRPAYSYMAKDKIEKALGIKVRNWQEMVKEYINSR